MDVLITLGVILTSMAVITGVSLFVSEYGSFSKDKTFDNAEHLRWSTYILVLSPFTMAVIPIALVGGLGYVVWKTCVRFVPFVQTVISAFKLREEVDV